MNECPSIGGADVAGCLNWKVDDVILQTYVVRPISDQEDHHYAEGAMGRVYRVFHRGWGMDLAAKVPLNSWVGNAQGQKLFLDECQAWVDLALHPHTATCHYVRRVEDTPVVFAEFINGGTLQQWIKHRRLYQGGSSETLKRILDIAIQTAWGLHHAHQQQIVHQDVKPANVMMTTDGIAKIADFGLAKLRDRALSALPVGRAMAGGVQATYRGMTPAYCSPEQARVYAMLQDSMRDFVPPKLTRHTDMWSWAVSVLEMFTGDMTWGTGLAAPIVLENHCQEQLQNSDIPMMPATVAALLKTCFNSEPDGRFKDMAEVAVALRTIYQEITGEEHFRAIPKMIALRANGLNNKAISLLDLGDETIAQRLLGQALGADHLHPEATYNLGLLRWRRGNCTDDSLLTQLREIQKQSPDDPRTQGLIGLVHAERGDRKSAVQTLKQALTDGAADQSLTETLRMLQTQPPDAGQCLRTLEDHTNTLTDLAMTPDGKFLLSAAWDHTIRIWKHPSLECQYVLTDHTDTVVGVAVSADSRLALSGGHDNVLRLWDIQEGRCLCSVAEKHDKIWGVAISPDGKFGVVATEDNNAWIYELSTARCMRALKGHNGVITRIRFAPDGKSLVTVSWDEALIRWDFVTGKATRLIELHKKLEDVVLSPDGQKALVACEDATIRMLDLASGNRIRVFEGHGAMVNNIALSADGHRVLSASSMDYTMRLWDINSGRCLRTFENHSECIQAIAISPDGRIAYSGDKKLREWNLAVGTPSYFALSQPQSTSTLAASETGYRAKLILARRAIEKADIGLALQLISDARNTAGFAQSRKALDVLAAAGKKCRRIRLASVLSAEIPATTGGTPTCMAMEPNDREASIHAQSPTVSDFKPPEVIQDDFDRVALVGYSHGEVQVVGLRKHMVIAAVENQNARVEAVSFLRGGRRCLIVPRLKDVFIYDLTNGNRVMDESWASERKWGEVRDPVTGQRTINPDSPAAMQAGLSGKCATSWDERWRLLCSGDRQQLNLIDLLTNQQFTLDAGAFVECVAIMPDGQYGFSGGWDCVVKMWDLSSHQCVYTFEGNRSPITCVACSPDGRWLMAGGEDGIVRIWELVWDYEFPGWTDHVQGVDRVFDVLLTRYGVQNARDWNEEIYSRLLLDLQSMGFGWLRLGGMPERVRQLRFQKNIDLT
jgi:WD40 repeat protein/serine/threonine protein kinase